MKIIEPVTGIQRHEYTYPNPIIPLRLADAEEILRALNAGKKVTATIEIERAPLPKGYEWNGATINGPGDRSWRVTKSLTLDCKVAIEQRRRGVPPCVVDAFRAEGLLCPA